MDEEHKAKISIANKGKKRSESTRLKMSLAKRGKKASILNKLAIKRSWENDTKRRGENHWYWKGGITPERKRLQGGQEYKLWRKAVFERDDYTCIWCGSNNKDGNRTTLNADHIKPWCDYPELRFAIDNGRTLCIDCHRKTDTYGFHKKMYVKN